MVESWFSRAGIAVGPDADLSTHASLSSGVALCFDCRSYRNRSCRDDRDAVAGHRCALAHIGCDRRLDIANSNRADWSADNAVSPRRIRNFLFGRGKLRLPPLHQHRCASRTKTFRRSDRSGKSFCPNSGALCVAAVFAPDHDDAAFAARESFDRIRTGLVDDRNLFTGCLAGGRARFRAGPRTFLAFSTLRSGARNAAADLVSRILRGLQCVSVRFPPKVF